MFPRELGVGRLGLRFRVRVLLLAVVTMFIAGVAVNYVYADNTYAVSVSVQGLPPSLTTRVYVDGQFNETLNGGGSATINLSPNANPPTHTIVVDSYVEDGNGTRYFEQDTSWTIDGPGSHIFNYTAQYMLTVQTAYSVASGGGWYNSGSSATATLTSGQVNETQGVRNIFTGWSGDATGIQTTSNAITMNAPKTAVANWKTQFLLGVESDPPDLSNLTGAGWYDAGSQANFSAPPTVPATADTRLRFVHWSGDYNGQSSAGLVLMDHPKTETANYVAQYLLTVAYSPVSVASSYNETHAGWFDAGSDVQLGPAPSTINLSTVERLRFIGWVENSSESANLSYTVTMNSPLVVTLSYRTQYYLDVQSSYGSVTGSGWYDRGSAATITAPTSSGTWPIPYVLTGWVVSPSTGNLTRTDDSWSITVNGPYVVQAEWSVDYVPIIELFGGLSASIIAVAVAVGVAYRRGALTRGSRVRPQKTSVGQQPLSGTVICSSCGNNLPRGATVCGNCGASVIPVTPSHIPSLDERVYDYILKHEGTISLSEASTELGIPVDRLKEITERLKKQGRLG